MNSVNPENDDYFNKLKQWCQKNVGSDPVELSAVSGDAGFRSYYRLSGSTPAYIAVYAPPATEKNLEFVQIASTLREFGLLAPQVFAVDYTQGFMLISDLGSTQLLAQLNDDSVLSYYRQAIDAIVVMQKIPKASLQCGDYDKQALQRELDLFTQWFVPKLLSYNLSNEEQALINALNEALIASALEQPQAFVHRDFHSRNLMVCDEGLGLIDFQDALWGAATYDVVSLLKDCYVQWPVEHILECLAYYHQVMPFEPKPTFDVLRKQFDWMGLQRHIKVLGIFARLSLRDNKHAYLQDLPRVIDYTLKAASAYPETQPFYQWFTECLMPIVRQQDWYKPL